MPRPSGPIQSSGRTSAPTTKRLPSVPATEMKRRRLTPRDGCGPALLRSTQPKTKPIANAADICTLATRLFLRGRADQGLADQRHLGLVGHAELVGVGEQ